MDYFKVAAYLRLSKEEYNTIVLTTIEIKLVKIINL